MNRRIVFECDRCGKTVETDDSRWNDVCDDCIKARGIRAKNLMGVPVKLLCACHPGQRGIIVGAENGNEDYILFIAVDGKILDGKFKLPGESECLFEVMREE